MAQRFGLIRRKEQGGEPGSTQQQTNPASAEGNQQQQVTVASDETRAKVEAAKAKIENMYKVQNQNIQERLLR